MKKVIDVSYAQGVINWDLVKPHIDGAILRCGYGSDIKGQDDNQWGRNVRECERLGIPYGTYLYSYAKDYSQSQSEINHCLRLMKGHNPTLGVFLDLEENDLGFLARSHAERWCKQVNGAGYKAGIYCGAYYYKSYLVGAYETLQALWWIAGYGTNSGKPEYNFKPNPGFPYDAWQYTSNGRIPGISTSVDVSEWYDDSQHTPEPVPIKIPSIRYAVKTLHHGIREFKKNGEVAGYLNDAITGIAIGVDGGSVKYRVHLLSGRWLPWVYGCDWKNDEDGYAGVGDEVIDAIQIMYYTDTAETAGRYYEAVYCVRPVNYGFLPSVYDTDESDGDGNGTAGIFGAPFVEIKISLSKNY